MLYLQPFQEQGMKMMGQAEGSQLLAETAVM